METALLGRLVGLATALFVIGALGVLWRRNLLIGLLSLQLMLAAGQLAFVAFGRGWSERAAVAGAEADGQAFALVALIVAVVQLAVGLAIVLAFVRNRDSLDVEAASTLRW